MFRDIASVDEILPGGMKAYEVDGNDIVLCNDSGRFYAFQRRCGHMSAPLDMGTANGYIITCPLHSVQFDAATGKALSPPLLPSASGAAADHGQFDALGRNAHGTCQDLRHPDLSGQGGKRPAVSVDV